MGGRMSDARGFSSTICGKDYLRRDRIDRYIDYMLKNPHYFRQLVRAEPTIQNIRQLWKRIWNGGNGR
jgi:hypothetical protein